MLLYKGYAIWPDCAMTVKQPSPSPPPATGLDCKWNCYQRGGTGISCQSQCCHTVSAPQFQQYGYWDPSNWYAWYGKNGNGC